MKPQTSIDQTKERYQRYHSCFASDDGKWVLEDFAEQFLHLATECLRYADGNNPIGLAAMAAQQALLTKIREHALGEPPIFEEPVEEDVFNG